MSKEKSWTEGLRVGKQAVPPRICIYGGHGIGKSTLASRFPTPIFISTEDGLNSLDVTSFPKAKTLSDVVSNIGTLFTEKHDFKTVVVDSVDWLVEPLIVNEINAKYDEKEQSFGKGSMYIAEAFREVLQGLDALRLHRGMNVVLIAHASVVKFEDPRTEPYDRYQPKLPNRCNAMMQEWVDVLAFAAFKVIIKKDDSGFSGKKTRGTSNGDRLLHFVETPAYVAKNRYSCPEDADMTIESFKSLIPVAE